MPVLFKTKWMTEHPTWPWFVFIANIVLIVAAISSIVLFIIQQKYLIREVNDIDAKLVQAIKVNQNNIETIAKKVGVPDQKIVRPELPIISDVK